MQIADLRFYDVPIHAVYVEHEINMQLRVTVEDGFLQATTENISVDFQSACNYAEKFIQRIVDSLAFVNGFGCLVLVEQILKDGKRLHRNHRFSKPIHQSREKRPIRDLSDMEELLKGPPELGEALYNLNLAIFLKHETEVVPDHRARLRWN